MAEAAAQGSDIQDFILERELAEVCLLLDHVSATPGKTMPGVIEDEPVFGPPEYQKQKSWIEQICDIVWPSEARTGQAASDAAKLLRAKDILNKRAYPASGATIAFTVMMSNGRKKRGASGDGEAGSPSRIDLAERAYPSYVRSVEKCRVAMYLQVTLLVAWLILTCALSWDVATGSALLNRYNSLDARIVDLRTSAVKTPDPGTAPTPTPSPDVVAELVVEPGPAASPSASPSPSPTPSVAPGSAAERATQTDLENAIEQQQAAAVNLRKWLDSGGGLRGSLIWVMGGGNREAATGETVSEAQRNSRHVEWAAVALGILANSVLPIFYGLLGAGAAAVRIVSAKMRDSTLSPRDIVLAWVRLALGAVIGACIGLFVTPDGSGSGEQPGLLGPVHLSASALCFVAGFGVEAVFQAIEALIQRLFNFDTGKNGAGAEPKA